MSKAIWTRVGMCFGGMILALNNELAPTIMASALIIAFEIFEAGERMREP